MAALNLFTARTARSAISRLICLTPLQYWPVRVRSGLAKGARWTAFPFSRNWREGGSEPEISAAIHLAAMAAGDACWDLGAHFGIHTVGLAFVVGPLGEVAAFEPDPLAFRRLARHVEINELRNVKLFNAAVSNVEGSASLIVTGGLGSTLSHLRYEDEPAPVTRTTRSLTVRTVVLDVLVDRGDIRPPGLIKVDIQGHGAQALKGANRTIEKHRPVIVFSGHSPWEFAETRELLEGLGYWAFNPQGHLIEWENFTLGDAILFPKST